MTRVNLTLQPSELCNQMLWAEYREMPRVFSVDPTGAPSVPCLGRGHVKWCATKPRSMAARFRAIVRELIRRGFSPKYLDPPAGDDCTETWTAEEVLSLPDFDAALRARIRDRLATMKRRPTWTNRTRPEWTL